MSGGISFVYNPNLTLQGRSNPSTIDFDPMDKESISELLELITNHFELTGSKIAEKILSNWDEEITHFVKVMPKALKEVLEAKGKQLLQAS